MQVEARERCQIESHGNLSPHSLLSGQTLIIKQLPTLMSTDHNFITYKFNQETTDANFLLKTPSTRHDELIICLIKPLVQTQSFQLLITL